MMKFRVKKSNLMKISNIASVIIILIINFGLCVFYTIGNYNCLGGRPEHSLLLNPRKVFREYVFTWDDSYNLGGSTTLIREFSLISALFIFLRKILDPKSAFFFYKFLLPSIAGITMLYFSKTIFRECKYVKNIEILSFISAFIYMFNPFTATMVAGHTTLMVSYALTPAILYFLMLSTEKKRSLNLFIATILLSCTFLFVGAAFVALFLILLFASIYSVLIKRKIIINTLIAVCISILLTLWYILPALYSFLHNVEGWRSIGEMERFHSIRANVVNTLTLTNWWNLFMVHQEYKVFYFSDIYKCFDWLLLIVPIVTFSSLLFFRKIHEDKHLIVTLQIICIVGITLAQGTNQSSPFSNIYKFLLENVPIFNVVRNSTKFNHLIIFSYSILFPYSLYVLYKNVNKRCLKYCGKMFILILILTGSSIYFAPFGSGKLFNKYSNNTIPEDILLVSEYINHDNCTGNVLILPGPWLSTYTWLHPHTTSPIYFSTIEKPILFRYGGRRPLNIYSYDFLESLYKNFFSIKNTEIFELLRIKYILIDGTVDINYFENNTLPSNNISDIKQFVDKLDNITYINQFGKIYLYRYSGDIVPEFFIPTFYICTSNSSPEDILLYWNNVVDLTKFAIGEERLDKAQLYDKNVYYVGDAQIIDYVKVNPTLWQVRVEAKSPFMLGFVASFDPLWEARIYRDGKLINKVRSIPIYGVINGFWIDETGSLTIIIRYTPQDWFELGLRLSSIIFVICIFCLIWDWRKDRGDKWAIWLEKRLKAGLNMRRKEKTDVAQV